MLFWRQAQDVIFERYFINFESEVYLCEKKHPH